MEVVVNLGESLTAVMSGAAATTNPTYATTWTDGGNANQPVGSLAGATAVTLVAGANAPRRVTHLTIYNADTSPVTVTVSKVVSGTSYTLFARTIAVGSLLQMDANGLDVTASSTVPSGVGAASIATVAASEQGDGLTQRSVLTLTNVPVTVGNTTGVSFGGTKIYDFPAGRLLIEGVTIADVSFGLTDALNVTPINGTMGGDIALGTTVAGDGTLTGADVDLCPSTSIDPISDGVAGAALAASAQLDGTTTAKDMYFNILIDDLDVANAASDVLLVNAVVTVTWKNLGTY